MIGTKPISPKMPIRSGDFEAAARRLSMLTTFLDRDTDNV
jgi:hypothetical protein